MRARRIQGHRKKGYTEEDLSHKSHLVRIGARNFFGWIEKDKKNSYRSVRLEAYKIPGFDRSALKDKCPHIRQMAQSVFGFDKIITDQVHGSTPLERIHSEEYMSVTLEDAALFLAKGICPYKKLAALHLLEGPPGYSVPSTEPNIEIIPEKLAKNS